MTSSRNGFKFTRMVRQPLILVTASIEKQGVEFHDLSASLSLLYNQAILQAGGIPVTMPATTDSAILEELLGRIDGVLLTGGDDINPALYAEHVPRKIMKTVVQTPDGGVRDLAELLLIQEIFRQRKPTLAICRGHQLLNVAFGGQLAIDIPQQVPGALRHGRMDKPFDLVHEVALTAGSLVSKICNADVLGVNSTHHQGVVMPAEPFTATASSSDGVVEAMELKPEYSAMLPFLLSVQFHPERLAQKHARYRAVFAKFVAACAKPKES
jgi:putative glutamine amidotransferase